MVIKNLVYAIFISIGFVGWGIIAKYSHAHGSWVSTLVMFSGAVTVAGIYSARLLSGFPDTKAIIVLVIAGIVNGLAVCLFSARIADPVMSEVAVAAFITTVYIAMIIMTPVINMVINGVAPTANHIVGYALAVAAVYFLSK